MSTEIVIIAAMTEKNRVIGINNELPWYLPEDLKRFKKLTLGSTVLMGRKTFESIVARLGKPLPERQSLVLSNSLESFPEFPDVKVYKNFENALQDLSPGKSFIIGGESLFAKGLEIADCLELTIIEREYEGDAFFPDFSGLIGSQFQLAEAEPLDGYRFETYLRL